MNLAEVLERGNKYYCLICKKVYKEKPQELYEDGHGGRYIDMCRCGCDLIGELKDLESK